MTTQHDALLLLHSSTTPSFSLPPPPPPTLKTYFIVFIFAKLWRQLEKLVPFYYPELYHLPCVCVCCHLLLRPCLSSFFFVYEQNTGSVMCVLWSCSRAHIRMWVNVCVSFLFSLKIEWEILKSCEKVTQYFCYAFVNEFI